MSRFMIANEQDLAAVASSLIGKARLTARERHLVPRSTIFSNRELSEIRARIRAGDDPLGDYFCKLRPPEMRRGHGATYTPKPIIHAMIAWAAEQRIPPKRIVDPGAGSGRFLMAAAKAFPQATLIAIEIDPLAALMMRANAAVLRFADRLSVELTDYRGLSLSHIDGPTLFIGNPPYVRHHDISPAWKNWFSDAARKLGLSASALAGLHVHFFVKTYQLARAGDFGTFITAAEWLDVNYGAVLRHMLANDLGGTAIHVIDPKALPFAETLATGAISCFCVGRRPHQLTVRSVETLEQLAPLSIGRGIDWNDIEPASRWSVLLRTPSPARSGEIELGELFRVHRGQVTGSNAVWVAGEHATKIPARFLFPAITKAKELFAVSESLEDISHLRKVVDLPVDLDDGATPQERRPIDEFLEWARRMGAHRTFIATHRRAWWAVGLRPPAPILCTYMARRAPAFVRNRVGARHLNVSHGLYPLQSLSEAVLDAIARHLRQTVCTTSGRVYAGGLVKFEPGEVQRLLIPEPSTLHGTAWPFPPS
jgi:adenine-specific DNA-methyltransferase